jgi:hypothetical protein
MTILQVALVAAVAVVLIALDVLTPPRTRRARPGTAPGPKRAGTPNQPPAPRRVPPPVISPGEARLLRELLAAPDDPTDCVEHGRHGADLILWYASVDDLIDASKPPRRSECE